MLTATGIRYTQLGTEREFKDSSTCVLYTNTVKLMKSYKLGGDEKFVATPDTFGVN
jgi:hypothetical protein